MQLADRPVRSIVRAISDAANRWSKANFPPRVRALDVLCARTGYSRPVVEYALDRLFLPLTLDAIETAITGELGSLDLLDDFVRRADRLRTRAFPLGRICIISSRTTIGVALVPAIFALCAKCEVLVKDREDHLIADFFTTLAEEFEDFRVAARAQTWNGSDVAEPLDTFDGVVAFGDDATLARIAGSLTPSARFIGYGSKASAGYVAREALASDRDARALAERAARDLVLYDSEGCLSLHVLFVERAGSIAPERFVALLADAIERAAVEFPLGWRSPQTSLRVAAFRDVAAFRATAGRGAAYSDSQATYCIALDPPDDAPPAFLPRTLGVYAVDTPFDAIAYLTRAGVRIEALAVAAARKDVIDAATRAGAARIARFGELQSPPLGTFHGGRPRITEFIRWVSDET